MLEEFKDSKEDLPLVEGLQFGKIVIYINNEGQRKAYVLGLEGDTGLACLNFSRVRPAHSGAWRCRSKFVNCKTSARSINAMKGYQGTVLEGPRMLNHCTNHSTLENVRLRKGSWAEVFP
jgi:hypothetical protein